MILKSGLFGWSSGRLGKVEFDLAKQGLGSEAFLGKTRDLAERLGKF